MEQTEKLIIVGAGPAGCATALEASRHGLPCIVLDRATFPRDKICGDALSGKVVDGLNRLGITTQAIFSNQAQALPSWGICFGAPSGEVLRIPFRSDYNSNPDSSPGYLMPRLDFDLALVNQINNRPEIDFRPKNQLTAIRRNGSWIELEIQGHFSLRSRTVVAADGVHSVARKLINPRPWPARHHCAGVRGYFEGVEGLEPNGFIELHFLRELLPGYLWVFPLSQNRANVGLGMRSDIAARRRVGLRQLLIQLLQNHPKLKSRFAKARPLGPVMGLGLPLGSRWARLAGPGILHCGDAGSLIDPFTGEGIGNALLSGRLAGQQFAEAMKGTSYNPSAIEQYPELLRKKLGAELHLSSWLQRLSSWPWLFSRIVKQANRHEELKRILMCMFEDVNLRQYLTQPRFYLKWILG